MSRSEASQIENAKIQINMNEKNFLTIYSVIHGKFLFPAVGGTNYNEYLQKNKINCTLLIAHYSFPKVP